ncbi:MAG: low specificity L-threonine aldolase [Proteobacteria bacterium]|nr:low specificity L-threonine aldolase [Pseudomonadota bacterium]
MLSLIDLGSDTATKPTREMIAFMMGCAVGDDQKQEDPTVNALQDQVADLLGKEASIFLPSATMANEIALKVHTRHGDEVILDASSHYVTSEAGGPAFLSGVMLHGVVGARGIFTGDQVEAGIRRDDLHCPRTSLVCVEQTTNRGGGAVWSLDQLKSVAETAHRLGLATHMDGSRLINAMVASGQSAAAHANGYDSVTLCLTKGLGCPIGALLAGNRPLIKEARRYKHLFGGAMRQAGIVAGAGLYALRHNVNRLADDHANAKLLATLLSDIPGIRVNPDDIRTNIVFFDVGDAGLTAQQLVERLRQFGVRMGAWPNETLVRAVTHLDVTSKQIEIAASRIREIVTAATRDIRVASETIHAGEHRASARQRRSF